MLPVMQSVAGRLIDNLRATVAERAATLDRGRFRRVSPAQVGRDRRHLLRGQPPFQRFGLTASVFRPVLDLSRPRLQRRRRRAPVSPWLAFGIGCSFGAAVAFMLDPQMGRRRRKLVLDQLIHYRYLATRDVPDWTRKKVKWLSGRAGGLVYEARSLIAGERRDYDEATLADKVRSEVGLSHEVTVNVENGVVVLRGTLADERKIEDLVRRVRKVKGVRGVQNLIHTSPRP